MLNKFKCITTTYSYIRPISLSDDSFVHKLRSSLRANSLSTLSESVEQQRVYLNNYLGRNQWNDGLYLVACDTQENPMGLVRLTELQSNLVFSWESLIFDQDSDPNTVLDTILSVMWLGFEYFGKILCGPFPVPKDLIKVQKLHAKMGMVQFCCEHLNSIYYTISKDKYIAAARKFNKLGFNNIRVNYDF